LDPGGSPPLRGLAAADAVRLARLPMFADLAQAKRAEIIEEASVVAVSRRTVLFYQGEPATRFYVVLDGCVMLHRVSPNGHQSVISLINRGESFAEAAMFDCADFPVTATVIADARLLVVTAQSFRRRLMSDPSLALNILASMSRQMRRLVEQIEQRSSSSSTERLARFLLQLCPEDVAATELELPLDKQLIAGALGMQPETFSRCLSRLKPLGVRAHGNHVEIADIAALQRLCSGDGTPRMRPGGPGRR
jgi:CRP-like cAMP-binding protein